jgi:hypothetical protein
MTADRKAPRAAGHRYGILALAIAASLAWHLFWISAVKVVPAKAGPAQAKYSKVSFLGQIFSKAGLGVREEGVTLSPAEKRYNALSAASAARAVIDDSLSGDPAAGREADVPAMADAAGKMRYMTEDAVSGPKIEPDRGFD